MRRALCGSSRFDVFLRVYVREAGCEAGFVCLFAFGCVSSRLDVSLRVYDSSRDSSRGF